MPPPMMSWQKDGKIIPTDHPHYRIDSEPGRTTLYIASVEPSDNAWYQCSAVSVSGTAANRARLIVQGRSGLLLVPFFTMILYIKVYKAICKKMLPVQRVAKIVAILAAPNL